MKSMKRSTRNNFEIWLVNKLNNILDWKRLDILDFDETYGIDKIKNLVEKIKEEREEADKKEFWNVTMSYVMENGFTKDDKIDKLNSRDGV